MGGEAGDSSSTGYLNWISSSWLWPVLAFVTVSIWEDFWVENSVFSLTPKLRKEEEEEAAEEMVEEENKVNHFSIFLLFGWAKKATSVPYHRLNTSTKAIVLNKHLLKKIRLDLLPQCHRIMRNH